MIPYCAPQPVERVKPPLTSRDRLAVYQTPSGGALVTPEPFRFPRLCRSLLFLNFLNSTSHPSSVSCIHTLTHTVQFYINWSKFLIIILPVHTHHISNRTYSIGIMGLHPTPYPSDSHTPILNHINNILSVSYKCNNPSIFQKHQKQVKLCSSSARLLAGPPWPPGGSSQNQKNAVKMLLCLAEHS